MQKDLVIHRSIAALFLFCFSVIGVFAQENARGAGVRPQQNTNDSAKRLALVIGNAVYQNAGPLVNTVNDANDMTTALQNLGFEVIRGTNSNKANTKKLIADFGAKLKAQQGVGLFYYAGHGVEYGGRPFIIPVDANITAENLVETEAVDLDLVIKGMQNAANGKNIVILDSCRTNPFSKTSRGISEQGRNFASPFLNLAEATGNPAGNNNIHRSLLNYDDTGLLLAYSSSPGTCGSDGVGKNGLYTQELLKNLQTPNITLEEVFRRVRISVRSLSNGNQIPTESSTLVENIYLAGRNDNLAVNSPKETFVKPDQTSQPGRYHALVIGINAYQNLPRLQTAEVDARVIEATLRDRFGFQTKMLLNADANRQKIFEAVEEYRRSLTESDSLLVYYAGHGYFDKETDNAYWLPADATQTSQANWVSANDITSVLKAIPAKHILVVSDSCYSGAISRQLNLDTFNTSASREKFLEKMLDGKSRNLMASGGNEPVSDSGGGKHSVFANAFLIGLNQMENTSFTGSELFQKFVQERVTGNSDQTPEYNPIRNSGHNSGDFVFVRKY